MGLTTRRRVLVRGSLHLDSTARCAGTHRKMARYQPVHFAERTLDSQHLQDDVLTIGVSLDHANNATEMALRRAQAKHQFGLEWL